jgi:hypothetical protein
MDKPSVVVMDTKDDRRELWSLLHRLPPGARVAFLMRCCSEVRKRDKYSNGPVATGFEEMVREAQRCDRGDDRLTNEVYGQMIILSSQWGLDLYRAGLELERRARTHS